MNPTALNGLSASADLNAQSLANTIPIATLPIANLTSATLPTIASMVTTSTLPNGVVASSTGSSESVAQAKIASGLLIILIQAIPKVIFLEMVKLSNGKMLIEIQNVLISIQYLPASDLLIIYIHQALSKKALWK